MFAFILRRLFQSLIVMLSVALIAFAMFRFVGDPVNQIVSIDTPQAQVAEIRRSLGLDDPFLVQFARYIWNAARLEFGVSYQFRLPVISLLGERAPATLELALMSALFSLVVGIPMGVYTALKRESWLAKVFQAVSLIGISLPTFLIGIGLIYVFAVELRWLPSFGRGETVALGWWTTGLLTTSGLKSLVLPVLTLGFLQLTLIMRLVRSEMLEVMRADFIRFARARGIPERKIEFRHALRNTMIPVITIAGLQLGGVIAFAIVTETVFQWPGLGALFVNAVQFVDVPVMSAYLMFVAFVFVLTSLIVDLIYVALDPRLRTGNPAMAK